MNTHIKGVKGEDVAAQYLAKHNYEIIKRNYKCHFGEIDIIAVNEGFVVFAEVKSRSSDKFGLPREAVSSYKQQRIIGTAKYWLYKNKVTGVPVRFDVVEVVDGVASVIRDAFRP